MSENDVISTAGVQENISVPGSAETPAAAEPVSEPVPSMDEFKEEIAHSFRKINVGDIVNGTVIGLSDTEVTVDLNSYSEGIIPLEELSNDPRFSIKADIAIGTPVSATVLRETREGVFILSLKAADNVLAWDKLEQAKADGKIERIKVAEAVNAGVTTYLYGIRAFIPASQLALTYVEDPSEFVGRELDVVVSDVDREKEKLVLSAKTVLRERAAMDKKTRIGRLQTGLITKGIVEKIMPFGAFVNIGEDLSGLVHISEICGRRLKSVHEVLKEGDEVTVKILDVKDGKISLSIKAALEKDEDEVLEDAVDDAAEEYSDGEAPTTSLAGLLKGLKLPD
ncbi:MAG: S1 RNA-binding domain-containing protein [Lachnospiraceae bacterium]|nr:S1 RNA-binding domain-containing protein [Lachnospiraceae bacterium]